MVEVGVQPVRRAVANLARGRERPSDMIGIGRSGEILLVARIAVRRRAHKYVVHVAL